jgi:transcriptional regulator with XRE-family HTH domain
MPLLRRVIGAVLRRIRLGQGRTLREVAAAAGVSLPYLSEVERGTKEASSEVLAAICRALGLPMPELLDEVRKEMLRQAPAPASRFVTHLSAASDRHLSAASDRHQAAASDRHRSALSDRHQAGRNNGPRCAVSRWVSCASRVTVRL